jgi:hypothetical protein
VGCGAAEPPFGEEGAARPTSDGWSDDTAPGPVTGEERSWRDGKAGDEECPWLDGKAGDEVVMDNECSCATADAGAGSLTKDEPPSMDGRTYTEPKMGEEGLCCNGDMAVVTGVAAIDMPESERCIKPGASRSKVEPGGVPWAVEAEVDVRGENGVLSRPADF